MLDSPAIPASSLSYVFLLCSALTLVIFFLAQSLNAGGELGLFLWSRIESELGKALQVLPSTEQRDTGSFLPSGWVSTLGPAGHCQAAPLPFRLPWQCSFSLFGTKQFGCLLCLKLLEPHQTATSKECRWRIYSAWIWVLLMREKGATKISQPPLWSPIKK